MKRTVIILILTFLSFGLLHTTSASAQYDNHLILRKGYRNIHHYLSGDSIRFMRKPLQTITIGKIDAVGVDFIVIRAEAIPIREIGTIYHIRPFNFKAAGSSLQMAGPAFLLISAINSLLRSIKPIWTINNLVTSGSILATGLLLPGCQVKKYELGKRYNLRIVPSDPVTYKKLKN